MGSLAFPYLLGLIAKKPTMLSQAMHNAGIKALGLPYTYAAFDIERTQDALLGMRNLGIRGFSLTIPHKETALSFVDVLDPDAQRIGAVNTVINDGLRLLGLNTDWIGVREALLEAGIAECQKPALVFGAGGAARSAVFALKRMGVTSIYISNRTLSRAESVAKDFNIEVLALEDLKRSGQSKFSLVINATPLGSHLSDSKGDLNEYFTGLKGEGPALFEMVTKETPLANEARKLGLKVVPGSRMLLFQALEQFRLFTGSEPPVETMDRALNQELDKQS